MLLEKKRDGWLARLRNVFRKKAPAGAEPDDLAWNPRCDVVEDGDAYRVTADVRGVDPDDLHVTAVGHRLQMSGQREIERERTSGAVHAFERHRGFFARWFTLPDDADVDHATGQLSGGVVTVVIPKLAKAIPHAT